VKGIISGNYNITKTGNGQLVFTGANTYTGRTVVSVGALQIGDGTSGSIANTSEVSVNAGSTLRFEPGIMGMTFSKVISGNGNVEFSGNSVTKMLTLTADNTYTGTTTIERGFLTIGIDGTTGSIAGNMIVQSGGGIFFNRSDKYTYSGVISGAGSVAKFGAGKTILTGVNTYTGQTAVARGILQIGDGTSGSIANTSDVETITDATLRFEPGADMTFSKEISGAGKVEFKGEGSTKMLTFTANNTYTGTTTIEAGYLYISGTTGNIAGNIGIQSGGNLYFNRSNEYTYSGIISGAGNVVKGSSSGKTILTGTNTYTGETTVSAGTLQIGDGTSGSIAGTSDVYINPNCTLRFEPGATTTFSKVIKSGRAACRERESICV
jgi:autotransporter-associated beta strand protein